METKIKAEMEWQHETCMGRHEWMVIAHDRD